MKNTLFSILYLLLLCLHSNAQDTFMPPDSLDLPEQIFAETLSKSAEKPTRLIRTGSTSNAGKVIQAYKAQHTIAADLMELFKELNQAVEVYNDKNNNRLLLTGTSAEIDFALQQLDLLDEKQNTVTVEFMLVEYFHSDDFEWGFDIINGTSGNFKNARYTPAAAQGIIDFEFNTLAKLVPEFQFNLQALVNEDKAKIVTNPHLAVEAGEKASLELKDDRTIQLETATINGVTITLQNISAGIDLEIEPTMINDNLVKLQLNGEISAFLPFSSSGEFLREKNTINTVVDVVPGETLIIGGMIKEEYNTLEGGVPLLKDIPILGYLFKRKRKIKTYVERVMYITPHINKASTVDQYEMIRDKTALEREVSKMIEEDPDFIKYNKTKKAYNRRNKD